MQFFKNGPDIPERLLQEHEDGKVVFFCGAGISYPAGLPNFERLVSKLYRNLGEPTNSELRFALKNKQFDTAVNLLDSIVIGGREKVRNTIAEILVPNFELPKATATHKALLTLAKTREGKTRLITTNFDRIFEVVIEEKKLQNAVQTFKAPFLPVPKNRWNGLVYLHGLLSSELKTHDDHLVISSGDFGLAYLTEGWASRFITELFRNYTICFVGYSINDPILRYMMDALAADRLLGESPPEMFVFSSYSKKKNDKEYWQARNVTPILYDEDTKHFYLHETLHQWSKIYQDGLHGKAQIVVSLAITKPSESTKEDNYVDRMLWALSDLSGLPAKQFAELEPCPSLDWLEPLSEKRFCQDDLNRFNMTTKNISRNDNLKFSVILRPASHEYTPWMSLVNQEYTTQLDNVMFQLARWLTRHVNNPKLLLWLAKYGGQLHEKFVQLISNKIVELEKLSRENKDDELERIKSASPNAIPNTCMITLWQLFLSKKIWPQRSNINMYSWLTHFKEQGFTPSVKMELLDKLTPRVIIRNPILWINNGLNNSNPQRTKDIVDYDIVLSANDVHDALSKIKNETAWQSALPNLLFEFNQLLHDALDLMRKLGGADDHVDFSYVHQPSISEHQQNNNFNDWTALIELTRDAWLATVKENITKARLFAQLWWETPYPIFKRLAFYATMQEDVIPIDQTIKWLKANRSWWLWSTETQREVMQVLAMLSSCAGKTDTTELEDAILQGPPREMFRNDLEPQKFENITDHAIWLRLAKLHKIKTNLGNNAKNKFVKLTKKYPSWKLEDDNRDEFPYWMSSGDGESLQIKRVPRKRRDLVKWIEKYPNTNFTNRDDWQKYSRENFLIPAYALCALSKKNLWPNERWNHALQAWVDNGKLKSSWQHMTKIIATMPNDKLNLIIHSLSYWLQAQAKTFEGNESLFLDLIHRTLTLEYPKNENNDDPVFRAINHPIGQVTEALLRWFYRSKPKDDQGLPNEIKLLFTQLCDTSIEKFRNGRVILAAHLITLFRVDRDWAQINLLPIFDWQKSNIEASSAWEGFLWSPRIYYPLLAVLKQPFLVTANHYSELGKHAEQYAAFLTFVALEKSEIFTINDLKNATLAIPPAGLCTIAKTLVRAFEGAGEQKDNYWYNRILPYYNSIWPKSQHVKNHDISNSFSLLCIAAGELFSQVFNELKPWLQPLQNPHFVIHKLHEANLCERFPDTSLEFLNIIIDKSTRWVPGELEICLEAIKKQNPNLEDDNRFKTLFTYLRQRN